MSTSLLRCCLIGLALMACLARADELDDVKSRLKIEAQRVEKLFAEGRAEAYRLVRHESPRLEDATEKLEELLALVRRDVSLSPARRELILRTLKFDLNNVRDIAAERRRLSSRPITPVRRDDVRPSTASPPSRVAEDRREIVKGASSIIEGRRNILADSREARLDAAERRVRLMKNVDESAMPDTRTISFPANWKELSARRSSGNKLTDIEKSIVKGLNTNIAVEYDGNRFEDVIDHLRKITGLPISADKRSLEEASVTYETPIKLKMRATARTILKRILSELNLAYVIKDETVLITTLERAKQMTVTKTYYLGDLVGVVGINIDPITSQLLMLERVNALINMITQKVERQSWQVNNPDAPGQISFHPATMTLIIKQTAEFHLMMGR